MNWNYLAGFFDGEGYVAAVKNGRDVWQVTQKRTEVLDEIQVFLEGYGLQCGRVKTGYTECETLTVWRVADVEFLCKKLLPKIIVKQGQTQAVLDAIKSRNRPGNFSKVKPNRSTLQRMRRTMTYQQIGDRLGVSANAVRLLCVSSEIVS